MATAIATIRPRSVELVPELPSEWLPLSDLKIWDKNPRKNDGTPVDKVARSIERFGFVAPIVVWRSAGRMVAGHTRLKALQKLLAANPAFTPKGAPGPNVARVTFHEFADEAEANAYSLADNRLAEEAEWDDEMLRSLVTDIGPDLSALAGFDARELSELQDGGDLPPGEDDVPALPAEPMTKLGDVWMLGDHVLVCGDSRQADVVARATAKADLLWTDPPYNVAIVGGRHGDTIKNRLARGNKIIDNDSMSDADFRTFLVESFTAASTAMREGAAYYITHPDVESFNFHGACRDVGWKISQCIIWVKDALVFGRKDYHCRHEMILYGWKEGAAHHAIADRTQDTIWEFPRPHRGGEVPPHPTMKPIALIDRAIKNSSNRGDTVLDTFAGSGSTLIACEQAGRKCAAVELDPAYCDVIVARWEKLTGKTAARRDPVAA